MALRVPLEEPEKYKCTCTADITWRIKVRINTTGSSPYDASTYCI